MAEIDLVSSHTPWTPLPRLVAWDQVGDGSIFDGMPAKGESPSVLWQSADQVRAAYGQSIQYSMNTLVSFVQTYPDPNLVLVVLGDHQPASDRQRSEAPATMCRSRSSRTIRPYWIGSRGGAGRTGCGPGPQAPVWPMDAFRNQFLTAYDG